MFRKSTLSMSASLLFVQLFTALDTSTAANSIVHSGGLHSGQPLFFTENKGQWDNRVLFKAEGAGGLTWFIERDGFTLVYSVPDKSDGSWRADFQSALDRPPRDPLSHLKGRTESPPSKSGHALKFRFVQNTTPPYSPPAIAGGATTPSPLLLKGGTEGGLYDSPWIHTTDTPAAAKEVKASARLSHNNNYFLGNDQSKWAPNCGNYTILTCRDVWEGIDVEWWGANFPPYAAGGEQGGVGFVEFDFIVHPGANPAQIRMECLGLTDDLTLTSDGEELLLPTSLGVLKQALPEAYQLDESGRTVPVPARFVVKSEGVFGVEMPEGYNAHEKLVVDPLVYSTYMGGIGTDFPFDIIADGEDGVIVTGYTDGDDFPTTEGVFDQEWNGDFDIFLTRFYLEGSELLYSTYIGGSGEDVAEAILFDAEGEITLAGTTNSDNFPTTEGTFDGDWNGDYDVIILKLNDDGAELLYSSYLGGSGEDIAYAISLDSEGSIVVAGVTQSDDFRTVDGSFDVDYNGDYDAFVSRFNDEGSELIYSSYLGGEDWDWVNSIVMDDDDRAVVVGYTESQNFPTTQQVWDRSYNHWGDAFVTKLDADGSRLAYSTFLGGNSVDDARSVISDGEDGIIVGGSTGSSDFPVSDGAYDQRRSAGDDAFITRMNSSGSEIIYSSFLGAGNDDVCIVLTPDGVGGTILTGWTAANDFPTTGGAYDRSSNGSYDAFIARFNKNASELLYSTYLGGDREELARDIITDGHGGVIVTGTTLSENFPTTDGAFDQNYGGGNDVWGGDVFITQIDIGIVPIFWVEIPESVEVWEMDTVEFTVEAVSIEEGAELTIDYHSNDLPDSARFEDHGDGSGTFSWQTTYDDAGEYAAFFILSDGVDSLNTEVVIVVCDVNLVREPTSPIPGHYFLSGNSPNPFNAQTRIEFGLPVGGDITLGVWDMTGRKWASLTSGYHVAGYYEAVWNAGTMPAGVYLVRMETSAGFNAVTKAVLVK